MGLVGVRHALRALGRHAQFTTAAVVTLALGSTAVGTMLVVGQSVLRPPSPFVDRALALVQEFPAPPGVPREPFRSGLTEGQLQAVRHSAGSLSRVGVYRPYAAVFGTPEGTRRLAGVRVSAALMAGLRFKPLHGRILLDGDEAQAGTPVVVLSERVWKNAYRSAPDVIGSETKINGVTHLVVGVMPAACRFPSVPGAYRTTSGSLDNAPEFWLSLSLAPRTEAMGSAFSTVAMLPPSVSLEAAQAEVRAVVPKLPGMEGMPVDVIDLSAEDARLARPVLRGLFAASLVVLLVASVNLLNLLVVRRLRDPATAGIRIALGATNAALLRDMLVEAIAVGLIAGLLSLLLTADVLLLVRLVAPVSVPNLSTARLSLTAGAAILLVAVFTAIAVTVASAGRVHLREPARSLRAFSASRSGLAIDGPFTMLLGLEVAAAIVLTFVAALTIGSYARAQRMDVGFDSRHVVAGTIVFAPGDEQASRWSRIDSLLSRMRHLPGVHAAGIATTAASLPEVSVGGRALPPSLVYVRQVTTGYLEAIGAPLSRGRPFPENVSDCVRCAVVNTSLAAMYQGSPGVLGQTVVVPDLIEATVVGIVNDFSTDMKGAPPRPEIYLPIDRATPPIGLSLMVRTGDVPAGFPALLERTAGEAMSDLALYDVVLLADLRSDEFANLRVWAAASGVLAAVALALACLGVFGLTSHVMAVTRHELSVRAALGASTGRLVWVAMRRVLLVAAAGAAAGGLLAVPAAGQVEALLFGVTPRDPATLALATFVVGTACAVASLPAVTKGLRSLEYPGLGQRR